MNSHADETGSKIPRLLYFIIAWPRMFNGHPITCACIPSTTVCKTGNGACRRAGSVSSSWRHELRHGRSILCFILPPVVDIVWVIMIATPIVTAHFQVRDLLFGMPCGKKVDEIGEDVAGEDQSYYPFKDRCDILVLGKSCYREDDGQSDFGI